MSIDHGHPFDFYDLEKSLDVLMAHFMMSDAALAKRIKERGEVEKYLKIHANQNSFPDYYPKYTKERG